MDCSWAMFIRQCIFDTKVSYRLWDSNPKNKIGFLFIAKTRIFKSYHVATIIDTLQPMFVSYCQMILAWFGPFMIIVQRGICSMARSSRSRSSGSSSDEETTTGTTTTTDARTTENASSVDDDVHLEKKKSKKTKKKSDKVTFTLFIQSEKNVLEIEKA